MPSEPSVHRSAASGVKLRTCRLHQRQLFENTAGQKIGMRHTGRQANARPTVRVAGRAQCQSAFQGEGWERYCTTGDEQNGHMAASTSPPVASDCSLSQYASSSLAFVRSYSRRTGGSPSANPRTVYQSVPMYDPRPYHESSRLPAQPATQAPSMYSPAALIAPSCGSRQHRIGIVHMGQQGDKGLCHTAPPAAVPQGCFV